MTQNYKRIAKNSLFLYFRMIIIMVISFYTTRAVLNTLGVTDFGLYNLVASFVAIMTFVNNALTSGTQRFLICEIERNDVVKLKQIFSTALIIHMALALFIFIVGETIGLWFLQEKMHISVDRFNSVFWVYQFAILSTMVNITQVPYNALIIAHEKMQIFAYISILEAGLKLLIVYLLVISSYDKLVTYALLMFLVSLFVALVYRFYCIKNYKESHFKFSFDKDIVKLMLGFSGWNLFGSSAWIIMDYGINIVLNIYYGPSLVTAKVISTQLNIGVMSLVNGFRTAVNPQIIKMFSCENLEEMKALSFFSAKYTFYLALFLILPVFMELDEILKLWLIEIPDWSLTYCKLILVFTLIQTFDISFGIVFQAIGDVKQNQILSGGIYLLVVPIFIIIEKCCSINQITIFYIQIIAGIIVAFVVKIYLLKKLLNIPILEYIVRVIIPIFKVLLVLSLFVFVIYRFHFYFIINMILSSLSLIIIIFLIDLRKQTRKIIFYFKN